MIELSDERLKEIGLYFKEFINEIEESRGYYEKSLVSPNNDNISSQGDQDISLSEESLSDEESLSNVDVSVLIKQADVLAEHITEYSAYMFKIPKDGSLITELSDVEIFRYIASTFIFADIENHPYNDIAKASVAENSGNAIYTLDSTQKMAYQLFGKENFLGNFENSYDESTKTYIIPIGAGFGNNLMVENVVSIQNGDTIETQVKLVEGPIGENYLEEFGTFKMVFEIINERNDVFLRFKEMSLKNNAI